MLDMTHIYMQINSLLTWVEHIVLMEMDINVIVFHLGTDLYFFTIELVQIP